MAKGCQRQCGPRPVGAMLLRPVPFGLREETRETDTVARLGGRVRISPPRRGAKTGRRHRPRRAVVARWRAFDLDPHQAATGSAWHCHAAGDGEDGILR